MTQKSIFEFISSANFGEPTPWSNTKPALVGVPIVFLTIAWICVLGRLYTRFCIIRSPWWDDLCVFIYALITTAATIAVVRATNHGLGQHFLKLSIPTMSQFMLHFYIINASYATSTAIIKIALLLQYLRIFQRGTKIYNFTVLVLVFTALWGLVYSVLAWVPCRRPSKYWSLSLDETCYGFGSTDASQLVATYESHTGINMALDLILLAIPLRLFWTDAGATRAQRLRLLGIFSLGAICIMFAAWRLAVLIQTQVGTSPVFDPTWYSGLGILLALMEVNCAAICGSVPIFWPQLSRRLGNIMVVREVEITTESRLDAESRQRHSRLQHSRDRSIQLSEEDEDSAFWKRMGAAGHKEGGDDGRDDSVYRLRQDSNSTIQMDELESADKRRRHYQDAYIMDQVDPLRNIGNQTVTRVQHR
ncbi:hypothetical protein MN608_10782 [Microdochium nivale]|nr:hypothetical protein MN608_10782 [Microdochium nivale]